MVGNIFPCTVIFYGHSEYDGWTAEDKRNALSHLKKLDFLNSLVC